MLVQIFSDPDQMTLFCIECIIAPPQVNIWKWSRRGCWSLHLKCFRIFFLKALCGALSLYKYWNWKAGLPEVWIHFRKCTLKADLVGSQDALLSSVSGSYSFFWVRSVAWQPVAPLEMFHRGGQIVNLLNFKNSIAVVAYTVNSLKTMSIWEIRNGILILGFTRGFILLFLDLVCKPSISGGS